MPVPHKTTSWSHPRQEPVGFTQNQFCKQELYMYINTIQNLFFQNQGNTGKQQAYANVVAETRGVKLGKQTLKRVVARFERS